MSLEYMQYEFDKCYKSKPPYTDASFAEDFNSSRVGTVEECKSAALENNKDFFLVTDFSNADQKTACLIPKVNKMCDFNNIENLVKPFTDVINEIFETSPLFARDDVIETSNNLYFSATQLDSNKNCLKYTVDKQVYAPQGRYALYKTKLVDDNIVSKLEQVREYKYYETRLQELNNYTELLQPNGHLAMKFKKYICNPNSSQNESDLDRQINTLKQKYTAMFNALDEITTDLSNISILTKYDNLSVEQLQQKIDDKKSQLQSILGTDGANNGKLHDTNYLKSIKIGETSILFIIIMSAIFIYSKKK